MNSVPIDYVLAAQVLPANIVEKIKHFNVVLFDIARWQNDYEPDISSLFICCKGGSFHDVDSIYGSYHVHNGTLVGLAEFSEIYYRAWLQKNGVVDRENRQPIKDNGFLINFQ